METRNPISDFRPWRISHHSLHPKLTPYVSLDRQASRTLAVFVLLSRQIQNEKMDNKHIRTYTQAFFETCSCGSIWVCSTRSNNGGIGCGSFLKGSFRTEFYASGLFHTMVGRSSKPGIKQASICQLSEECVYVCIITWENIYVYT